MQALSLHKLGQVAQGDRSLALLGELPLVVRVSDVLERLAAHMYAVTRAYTTGY